MPSPVSGKNSMDMGQDRAKDFRKSLINLLNYCRQYIVMMILGIILAIVGTILNVVGPEYLSQITDLITQGLKNGINIEEVIKIAKFLAFIYSIGFLFNLIQGIMMSDISQKISQKLRSDISMKINLLPLKYFDRNSYGDILSRITNDVDTIGQSLTQSLSSLVSSITAIIGTAFMMFYTNWIMAISGIISTLLGFIFMMIIIVHSQKYFSEQQSSLGKINGHIEENYSGHSIIKAYNGKTKEKNIFNLMNKKLYNSAWKSQFMSGLMMPLMSFIGNFGYVIVCIVGAVLVMKDKTTFGVIVAFMSYIRLFSQPLTQIAQVATSLQSAIAASERVFEFLDEKEINSEKIDYEILNTDGNVTFDHVKFGYNEDKLIIKDFSIEVKSGQKIAIVGPTGSGKTTLVNLLMRFYDINSGEIKIDGKSIQSISRKNLRNLFCMVLQDAWVFEGTIKENIVYCQKNVPDSQVIKVCKSVGIDDYVQSLPNKYETMLDDNISISQGQKQLITIARAMIENAPMLILDEATSSVDTRTEELIQKSIDKLMVGRTSFIIAHRLSTIKNADLILVLKEGDIIEYGTHKALLKEGRFYADLYNSQFLKQEKNKL